MSQENIKEIESKNGFVPHQRIIVIGASAGGFEVIKKLVAGLPEDLNASIFIVWHMSPDVRGAFCRRYSTG